MWTFDVSMWIMVLYCLREDRIETNAVKHDFIAGVKLKVM